MHLNPRGRKRVLLALAACLRLPPGEYEILALASFTTQESADGHYSLLAGTRIQVVE